MRRGRLQFGLRQILVAMAVACLAVAVVGAQMREGLRRKALTAELVARGGIARYEGKSPTWWSEATGEASPIGAQGTSAEHLALIGRMNWLERVSIQGATLNSTDLSVLRNMSKLRELSLSATNVGDAHAGELARLTGLEQLDLSQTPISDAGLIKLAPLTRLRHLELSGSATSLSGALQLLVDLQGLRVYEALEVVGQRTWLEEEAWEGGRLVTAHFEGPPVTDAFLDRMPVDVLEGLRIVSTGTTPRFCDRLGRLPRLRSVVVNASPFDEGSVRSLGKLAGLERLGITEISLAGFDLTPLAKLERLAWLDLSNTGVCDAQMAALSRLPKLKLLRLRNTEVTDAGLAALVELPELREIDLGHTRVTDDGTTALIRYPKLQIVNLDADQVSDRTLAVLARHPALELVQAEQTQVTEAGFERFRGRRDDRLLWAPPEAPAP